MRKQFEMTTEQLSKLLDACKPVPYIAAHCGEIRTPQESANAAWVALGDNMGFDGTSVQPIVGKGNLFFTAIEKPPILWTFEHDGEIHALEEKTEADANKAADNWFTQRVINLHDDLKNGDKIDDEVHIMKFYQDDEGERVVLERTPYVVEYEHYHGDHREHSYP